MSQLRIATLVKAQEAVHIGRIRAQGTAQKVSLTAMVVTNRLGPRVSNHRANCVHGRKLTGDVQAPLLLTRAIMMLFVRK